MKKLIKLLALAFTLGVMLQPSALYAQWTRNAATSQTYLTNTVDNVGIGTTNPLFKLDVQSATAASLSFKSTTGNSNIIIDRANSSSSAGVNYRTNGVPFWQSGTIGTDNYVIRNINLTSTALTILYSNSNVGIGTTAPAYKLDVNGTGNFAGALKVGAYTLPNVDGTSGQVLKTNGAGALTWSGDNGTAYTAGTGISIAGTTINSVWTASGNNIYNNNTANIGIGTSSPSEKLDIAGNIRLNNNLIYLGATGNNNYTLGYAADVDGPAILGFNGGGLGTTGLPYSLTWDFIGNATVRNDFYVGHNLVIDTGSHNTGGLDYLIRFGSGGSGEAIGSKRNAGGNQYGLDFWAGNANQMSITNSGNVGIGTTAPATKLHVYKSSSAQTPDINANLVVESNTHNYINLITPDNSENGILFGLTGNAESGGIIYNAASPLTKKGFQFRTGGNATRMVIDSVGKVGIGTAAPGSLLELSGANPSVRISTSSNTTQGFIGSENVSGLQGNLILGVHNPTNSTLTGITANTSKSCLRIDGYGIIGSVEDTFGINKIYNYRNMLDDGNGNLWVDYTGQNSGNGIGNRMLRFGTSSDNCGIARRAFNGELQFWNGSSGITGQRMIIENDGSVVIGQQAGNTDSKFFVNGYETTLDGKGACITIGNLNQSVTNKWHLRVGGIGTRTPDMGFSIGDDYGLVMTFNGSNVDLCGTFRAKEIRVETGWCDYVFKKDYQLKSLDQVEDFVNKNGHLEGIPTAAEIEKEGLKVGETTKALMEKIEELTLYVIQLSKENKKIANDYKDLKQMIDQLKN